MFRSTGTFARALQRACIGIACVGLGVGAALAQEPAKPAAPEAKPAAPAPEAPKPEAKPAAPEAPKPETKPAAPSPRRRPV